MPEIPKGAKRPNDRKKPAAQAETEGGGPTVVEWRGHSFTVESDPDDWSARTMLAFEEGKAISGVRGLLGPKQFEELMKDDPSNRDVGELFETLAEQLGFESSEN